MKYQNPFSVVPSIKHEINKRGVPQHLLNYITIFLAGFTKVFAIVALTGACTIKRYSFVMYCKYITYFEMRQCIILSITNTLTFEANTLAYYGIRTLRICNVFIVQALTDKQLLKWFALNFSYQVLHSKVGSGLTCKYQTRLKRLARRKHYKVTKKIKCSEYALGSEMCVTLGQALGLTHKH